MARHGVYKGKTRMSHHNLHQAHNMKKANRKSGRR